MDFPFEDEMCDIVSNKSETTENFGATRPPQHNEANESPQLVAGTTSAQDTELAAATQTQLHIDGDGYEDSYPIDRTPPSNKSNGTMGTDSTAIANVASSNVAFTTPAHSFPSKGLTESVLARHELQSLNPGDMGNWLDGASPGFTRLAISTQHKKRCISHAPRSKPSQASDDSYDIVALPATDAGRGLDIRSAGALFDEQNSYPHMYNPRLEL